MKTFCLSLSFLLSVSLAGVSPATAQLSDRFSDGNFTLSPAWNGDTAAWRIDDRFRLNTRDIALSQTVYLSTPAPTSKSAKWEFLLQMNFDPSASNRIRIYLSSTRAPLSGPLNGYFLQIGESGSGDSYDLYRQDSLAVTRIFEGPPVSRASDTLRCRFHIRRDTSGAWEIRTDPSGEQNFQFYGFFRDARYESGGHFGLKARYTASRSGKFFFDDLLVTDPGDVPVVPPARATWGTLFITEVLPDPAPAKGLPEAEFFELYNPTDSTVWLHNWTWSDGRTTSRFSKDSIAARTWLIVCKPGDTAIFSTFGPVAGLSPFPSLNNSGDRLKLRGPYGVLVDSLSYADSWYGDPGADGGGSSLERIAFSLPCLPRANWGVSAAAAGGTPGGPGSLGDLVRERDFLWQSLQVSDEQTLALVFNAFPRTALALAASSYKLNNGASVARAVLTADGQGVLLTLKESLRRGALYRLSVPNLVDCYGNPLKVTEREFLLPQHPEPGDVVINELLFNPVPGGADYVEIYNRSQKILDLKDLQLASGMGDDSLSRAVSLADSTALFYPGEYRLLTRYPGRVAAHHLLQRHDVVVPMEHFPAFYNESGSCVLLFGEKQIDQVNYREEMHAGLIVDPEGVSLEKIHFDLPSYQSGVFRSASATAGYGTPGYRNSQFLEEGNSPSRISLTNPVFSPGSGAGGCLQIHYRFPEPNLVGGIRIFDAGGSMVRRLAANQLLGTTGVLIWDGRDDHGASLQTGVYVLQMEVYSMSGWVERFRKTCVLASGL